MKTEKKILIAFILNLLFSLFEFIGGFFIGSVSIISDSIHDFGDATSIGISYFLEKKSKKKPNDIYTYGYSRYSILGSLLTIEILLIGSIIVIYNSILRIINPIRINYNGMIIFAIIGIIINFIAFKFTHGGHSLNQKAVNLHMLEDFLGWIIVLIGAIIMKFTNFMIIDSIMSIGLSIFIIINVIKNLKEIIDIFLEKIPKDINIDEIKKHILNITGVLDVHHIHIWTLDGKNNYATMHIVVNNDSIDIKNKVKEELHEHNINHITLEIEQENEICNEKECIIKNFNHHCNHHH